LVINGVIYIVPFSYNYFINRTYKPTRNVDARERSRLVLNNVKNRVKIVLFDQGKVWLCFSNLFLQKYIEQISFFTNMVS
jgi:hypothetical protein